MSQGKFSNPRPHREEEREIEQTFRKLTQKNSPMQTASEDALFTSLISEDATMPLPSVSEPATPDSDAEEKQIEEAFQKITGKPIPPKPVAKAVPTPTPEEPLPSKNPLERPQWMDEVLVFYQENTKLVLAALCTLALAMIVFVIVLFARSAGDPYGGKILNNVYIADVNVSGMSKKEAISAIQSAFGDIYSKEDMVIDLSGTKLRLTPKESGVSLDAAAAVEDAYAYGRTGTQAERDAAYKASKKEPHSIGILPYLNLKTENIRKFLTSKADGSSGTLVQTRYGLEGVEPELSVEKFDKTAPCQTLVIHMGSPGIGFDPDEVYNQILDAYSQRVFLVTVENVETLKQPKPIDLDSIYAEYYIAPVNTRIDHNGQEIPGSYGYEFDKKAAKALLDAAAFGEEIRIPMQYIEPDVLNSTSFFQDTLGTYQTRCTGNENRTTNLRLACQAIDGTVLNPGETFSFQNTVGQLSASKGYKSAPEDTGRENTMGGGVTQVSSTLYYAALLADLSITTRNTLEQMPNFIDSGFDATTSLKLKNTLSYPVRILAQVSGGYVKITIEGTETRDYFVMLDSSITGTMEPQTEYKDFPYNNSEGYWDGDLLQAGSNGYLVKTYWIKYDAQTGRQLSRNVLADLKYPAVNRIIARVAEPPAPTEITVPETTVPEVTVPETTLPTVTEPPVSEETSPIISTEPAENQEEVLEAA